MPGQLAIGANAAGQGAGISFASLIAYSFVHCVLPAIWPAQGNQVCELAAVCRDLAAKGATAHAEYTSPEDRFDDYSDYFVDGDSWEPPADDVGTRISTGVSRAARAIGLDKDSGTLVGVGVSVSFAPPLFRSVCRVLRWCLLRFASWLQPAPRNLRYDLARIPP
jgi:hypothetical protein